ncbi:unnamed protein product [Urochloa decumbens]|uniref:Uncharacterized protein n=1 Tax=Urochloa decumbens TaxID=240449 RepID=A0ABC8W4J2_9POAL
MAATLKIVVGSHIWLEDKDLAWIDGEVARIEGQNVHVHVTNGKTVIVSISDIHPKDTEVPSNGIDDMTRLSYLHEPGVLNNMAIRYAKNIIYTYTGNILIAINPFQRLPHLSEPHTMEKYKCANFGELDPHVFAIADVSYRQMMNEGKSNSILVSGESGAGKTETTKMLMRYLAFLGGRSRTGGRTVEQQVLESNPVLEAFGNAKTVRNNNSSRFGKFVEIQFDKSGKISVVYLILLMMNILCWQDIKRYKLADPSSFHYLNQSTCIKLEEINDAKEYLATRSAMNTVGITEQEQEATFRVVAAVLHLGNISFVKGREVDSSLLKDEKARFHLDAAAELLMCDRGNLENALIKRKINTPEGVITTTVDPNSATVSRDGLAKQIYSQLFDWLVNRLNASIGQDTSSDRLIGVLDIYGFESFKTNSFEQLCINFTNEKLQQHFNQNVFKMEQEEYNREQIDWSYIEFVDNQDVLDLIEKKPGGIIALLDEACMFPKCTHESFSQKLYEKFRNNKRFSKPKLSRTAFTIQHYAGEVTYQSDHFLDKNRDYVVVEHQELLNASKCSFVSGLFPSVLEENTKASKSSIATRFKWQLQELMETLSSTEPHYIRCIKPNNNLKPTTFENINVLQQLRCSGVLEAIRISCAGYPTRKIFHDFLSRFRILAPEVFLERDNEKITCQKILDKIGLHGYQAARDTEALKVEKEKLEEHVEELTSRLGLEKKLRIDLEKNKAGEISKLQAALREMEQRVEQATEMQERELAKRAIEEALAQEREKITLLTNEVEELKVLLLREQEENSATKSALVIAREENDAVTKKNVVANENMEQLRDTVKRFEKNVTELESSLMIEKEQNTTTRRELSEAHQRDEELLRQIADANRKSTELQTAVQRLQKDLIEGESTLLTERKESEATKKSLNEAHVKIEELLNKIEVAEQGISNFQDNIRRLEETVTTLETSLLTEKQQSTATFSQLAEAQQCVEVLQKKFADANKTNDLLQDSLKRCEENATTRDALYVTERQEHDQTKQALSKAQERNWELLRKVDDSEKTINKMLENAQRLEKHATARESLLLKTKQNLDSTTKALTEAQGRNRDLMTSFEDSAKKINMLEESVNRLEERTAEKDSLLEVERQENKTTKEEIANAQKKIDELVHKSQQSQETRKELEHTIKRFEADATARDALLLSEKQAHEMTKKVLTETQWRNEELSKKIQDYDKNNLQLQLTVERLQENTSATEVLLLREREQNSATMKAQAESQERNLQLLKKLEDVDKKIGLLQGSVQRLGDNTAKDTLLLSERCEKEALKKALTESEYKNEELLMKTEESNKKVEHLQNTINSIKEDMSASLEAERQENETIRRSLVEAQERNDVLFKKVRDSEYRAHQLQDTVQKLQVDAISRLSNFVMEKQEGGGVKNARTEAHGRNEDLIRRNEDLIKINDDLVKKIEDSGILVTQLRENLESLEGKAAALEAENQVLRQQAIATPPSTAKSKAACSKISMIHRCQEDGHILNGNVAYAEMKSSVGPTETRASMDSPPDLINHKDYENGQNAQSVDGAIGFHQIEAKYPALLFKQQLVDQIEKVYGMISDRMKKELNPLLELCIQDPRTSYTNQAKVSLSPASGLGQQEQLMHWLNIVKIFNNYLHILRANHVPSILVHKLLTQIFSMVNVQLFNRLLLRLQSYISGILFHNPGYVISDFLNWHHITYSAWAALRHIRQAVDFVVISLKPIRTWEEIRNDICPALSLQQLERIVGMYWDDLNGSNVTSAEFISSMRAMLREESNSVSSFSVLLDDDSSIPFSLEDIAKSMPNMDEPSLNDLLPFIRENQSFTFILQ